MSYDEVLKAVFALLDGIDLASCMAVCKQWRHIARDDYFWKCLCAERWPSICKRPSPPTVTYYKLYQTFYKQQCHTLLPPRLSFDDLEFFFDIWTEEKLIFSEVVPGPVLLAGIRAPPPGVCDILRFHLESPECKMTLPVEPRVKIHLSQILSVSVLVGRKDSNEVACVIDGSVFDYIDRTAYRAMAFEYLDFSPVHPFIPNIRAWISLLFMEDGNEVSLMSLGLNWISVMLQILERRFYGCWTCLIGSKTWNSV